MTSSSPMDSQEHSVNLIGRDSETNNQIQNRQVTYEKITEKSTPLDEAKQKQSITLEIHAQIYLPCSDPKLGC